MVAIRKKSSIIHVKSCRGLLPFILFLSTIFHPVSSSAQCDSLPHVQYLNWTALNLHIKWNDWGFSAEIQDRSFLKPLRQETILLPRLTIHKGIGKNLYAGAGIAYFMHYSPSNPLQHPEELIKEIRPHLEIRYKKHMENWNFKGRFRLEEKITERSNPIPEVGNWKWRSRGRWRLLFERYVSPFIYLKVSEELFISQGENGFHFSENRIRSGVGYDARGKRKIDLEYMHLLKDSGDCGMITRHTLVFTFTEIISL